jgi:hypothetical protein
MGGGPYLWHLNMQLGFYGVSGGVSQNGYVQLMQGLGALVTFPWALFQTAATSPLLGAAFGYDFWFIAAPTVAVNIQLQAKGNLYLLGAQLACFNTPTNIVASPGFIA